MAVVLASLGKLSCVPARHGWADMVVTVEADSGRFWLVLLRLVRLRSGRLWQLRYDQASYGNVGHGVAVAVSCG